MQEIKQVTEQPKKNVFEHIVSAPVVRTRTREEDLARAKQLCDMSESTSGPIAIEYLLTPLAELQGKSLEELKAMAGELSGLVRLMQEQAGYWLDAKEQLVMDAEMHNKMIASLVQYATQQQVQGNKKSPGKKPKK